MHSRSDGYNTLTTKPSLNPFSTGVVKLLDGSIKKNHFLHILALDTMEPEPGFEPEGPPKGSGQPDSPPSNNLPLSDGGKIVIILSHTSYPIFSKPRRLLFSQ